tara:strand:+ start:59 stop:220 length:162 start_codon:yes stop_codon:yes gene_type:complete
MVLLMRDDSGLLEGFYKGLNLLAGGIIGVRPAESSIFRIPQPLIASYRVVWDI